MGAFLTALGAVLLFVLKAVGILLLVVLALVVLLLLCPSVRICAGSTVCSP